MKISHAMISEILFIVFFLLFLGFANPNPSADNMFKGIYNGKQCHVADIPAVLGRAWSVGVDRIIVSLL